jgi:hypothetical protein
MQFVSYDLASEFKRESVIVPPRALSFECISGITNVTSHPLPFLFKLLVFSLREYNRLHSVIKQRVRLK